jgi:hypothetical protein
LREVNRLGDGDEDCGDGLKSDIKKHLNKVSNVLISMSREGICFLLVESDVRFWLIVLGHHYESAVESFYGLHSLLNRHDVIPRI